MDCPKCQHDSQETTRTVREGNAVIRRYICKQCRTVFTGRAIDDTDFKPVWGLFGDSFVPPPTGKAVVCPQCGGSNTRTNAIKRGDKSDRRTHHCESCGLGWFSVETIQFVYKYDQATMHSVPLCLDEYNYKIERERAEI